MHCGRASFIPFSVLIFVAASSFWNLPFLFLLLGTVSRQPVANSTEYNQLSVFHTQSFREPWASYCQGNGWSGALVLVTCAHTCVHPSFRTPCSVSKPWWDHWLEIPMVWTLEMDLSMTAGFLAGRRLMRGALDCRWKSRLHHP